MSSTVYGLSIDARDARAVATFWAEVLGRTVADGADTDNAAITPTQTSPDPESASTTFPRTSR